MKPQSSAQSARQQAARRKRLASSGVLDANFPRSKRRTDRSGRPLQMNRRRLVCESQPGIFKTVVRGLAIASVRLSAIGLRSTIKIGRKKIAGQPIWLISAVALCLSFFIGTGLGMIRAGLGRSPQYRQH